MSKVRITENRAFLIIIYRKKVFLLRKKSDKKAGRIFTLPGGHIDAGETPKKTAIRETEEEAKRRFHGFFVKDCYDCEIDGNRYYFFIVKVFRKRKLGIGEEDKFDKAGWFSINCLPSNMHPKIREAVLHILTVI